MRRPASLLGVAVMVAAVGWLFGGSVAVGESAGGCSGASGVTVVVDATRVGGGVSIGCAPGDPSDGGAALTEAGFSFGFVPGHIGFVCTINQRPNPCNGAPATAYWSYWHGTPGTGWSYSRSGAGSFDPAPGSVEGWSFGAGAAPGVSPAAAAGPAAVTTRASSPPSTRTQSTPSTRVASTPSTRVASTSMSSSSRAPTSQAPTSQAPTSQAPTSRGPASRPPATSRVAPSTTVHPPVTTTISARSTTRTASTPGTTAASSLAGVGASSTTAASVRPRASRVTSTATSTASARAAGPPASGSNGGSTDPTAVATPVALAQTSPPPAPSAGAPWGLIIGGIVILAVAAAALIRVLRSRL